MHITPHPAFNVAYMNAYDPLDLDNDHDAQLRQERAEAAAQQYAEDIKWLMSDKRGRRFVRSLLERGGAYRNSFNTNALTMAYHEGRRAVVNELQHEITTLAPERFFEMLRGK